jgi:hypothetical protein
MKWRRAKEKGGAEEKSRDLETEGVTGRGGKIKTNATKENWTMGKERRELTASLILMN